MPPWLVWVIVAAVLSVAELLTLTLAAGLLAVAAGAAAVTAALGVSAAGQAAAFAVPPGAADGHPLGSAGSGGSTFIRCASCEYPALSAICPCLQ